MRFSVNSNYNQALSLISIGRTFVRSEAVIMKESRPDLGVRRIFLSRDEQERI